MQTIFKGVIPFLIVEIIVIILIVSFPEIVLFLPRITS
jgi:TRAP-type mannitol/chloroaromatic compound transport system permease large subunit